MKNIRFIFVLIIVVLLLTLTGCGNKNKNENMQSGENNAETVEIGDEISYIYKENNNYVFIDDNANLVKISEEKLGKLESFLGTEFYENSILSVKDGERALIDFKGNIIVDTDEYGSLRFLASGKGNSLYEVYKDSKYGVINGKGEIVIPIEYDERFTVFNYENSYIYSCIEDTIDKFEFFDVNGKKVFSEEFENSNLYVKNVISLKSGIDIVDIRDSDNKATIVNFYDGQIIEEIDLGVSYNIDLHSYGHILEIDTYEGSAYGSRPNEKKVYYWFSKNKKFSKKMEPSGGRFDFAIAKEKTDFYKFIKEDGGYIIYNSEGKEVYKTENEIQDVKYYNEENGETITFFVEKQGKKYITMNSDFEKVFEKRIGNVGNKYIYVYSEEKLYNFDGSEYMENVIRYDSYGIIDLIVTEDGTRIENENKKIDIKEKLGEEDYYKVFEDKIFIDINGEGVIIKNDDLSIVKIKRNEDESFRAYNRYIEVIGDSYDNIKYYNYFGDLIYEEKE